MSSTTSGRLRRERCREPARELGADRRVDDRVQPLRARLRRGTRSRRAPRGRARRPRSSIAAPNAAAISAQHRRARRLELVHDRVGVDHASRRARRACARRCSCPSRCRRVSPIMTRHAGSMRAGRRRARVAARPSRPIRTARRAAAQRRPRRRPSRSSCRSPWRGRAPGRRRWKKRLRLPLNAATPIETVTRGGRIESSRMNDDSAIVGAHLLGEQVGAARSVSGREHDELLAAVARAAGRSRAPRSSSDPRDPVSSSSPAACPRRSFRRLKSSMSISSIESGSFGARRRA